MSQHHSTEVEEMERGRKEEVATAVRIQAGAVSQRYTI